MPSKRQQNPKSSSSRRVQKQVLTAVIEAELSVEERREQSVTTVDDAPSLVCDKPPVAGTELPSLMSVDAAPHPKDIPSPEALSVTKVVRGPALDRAPTATNPKITALDRLLAAIRRSR